MRLKQITWYRKVLSLSALSLAVLYCFSQTNATKSKTAPPKGMKSLGGCIYFSGGGNAQWVPVANACNAPFQFTITWEGVNPPHNVTYRINNWGSRTVLRQDTQGSIVASGPATTGFGGAATFRIDDIDKGNGTHLLMLVNTDATHIFVYGDIHIRDSSGKEVQLCHTNIEIDRASSERACTYFAGQTYIKVLQADKDAD